MMILGRTCLGVGRYAGDMAGAPNYVKRFKRVRIPRLLYHSGLDEVLQYPCSPDRTIGFSYDILARVDIAEEKTLTSHLTQQWAAVPNDVVIRERWESQLSQRWSFFSQMFYFWRTVLAADGYMIWRPLDLTDKEFRVHIVGMTVGSDEFDTTYAGTQLPDKWLTQPLEVHYRLISTFPPSASIFAAGPLVNG